MPDGPKTAAVYIEKGGVGKTTSAAHIGVAAAQQHGMDTLLLDLAGRQNDLATQFGLAEETSDPDAPISAVFGDSWEMISEGIPDVVDRMIFETDEGPDIIPSDAGLNGADNHLASRPVEQRYRILSDFIDDELADRYDFILIDLPGKEDNIALNGLVAVADTITPLKPGAFERAQLAALEANLSELAEDYPNVDPRLTMLIPTMFDRTTNQSAAFLDTLQTEYPDRVSDPVVRSADVGRLQESGQTLYSVPDDELYQTGRDARDAYSAATTMLLDRL